MALNQHFLVGDTLSLPTLHNVVSGDPVVVGGITGIALTDYDSSTGKATIRVAPSSAFRLPVWAVNDNGSPVVNSAVAVGDALYAAGSPETVSKDASGGTLIGWALETVVSGATTTIAVWLA